ncbi:hypothetical protein C0Q70_07034 [Pomacea canaliculata]|uniref:Uncharacterized protein n=1 Tax=Pomacea canaliculata TaxID=400727 RepID=A0A2T7PDY9_POMCA|nr:hypothetical protein C0Q70_07034 [Pomacea canaliculata]
MCARVHVAGGPPRVTNGTPRTATTAAEDRQGAKARRKTPDEGAAAEVEREEETRITLGCLSMLCDFLPSTNERCSLSEAEQTDWTDCCTGHEKQRMMYSPKAHSICGRNGFTGVGAPVRRRSLPAGERQPSCDSVPQDTRPLTYRVTLAARGSSAKSSGPAVCGQDGQRQMWEGLWAVHATPAVEANEPANWLPVCVAASRVIWRHGG